MDGRRRVVLAAALLAAAAAGAAALEAPGCAGGCPPGYVGSDPCAACPAGTFTLPGGMDGCAACPDGFLCAAGLLFARANRWPYIEALPGGNGTQGGGEAAITAFGGVPYAVGSRGCRQGACRGSPGDQPLEIGIDEGGAVRLGGGAPLCSQGREPFGRNPLCGRCGAGRTEWNGVCRECDPDSDAWRVVAVLVASLVWVVVLHSLANHKRHEATGFVKSALFLVSAARLVVGREHYWMSWLGVLELDPVHAASSRTCLWAASPEDRVLVDSMLPLYFAALLLLMYGADYAMARLMYHCYCEIDAHPEFFFPHSRYRRTALAGATIGYTAWTAAAARAVHCVAAGGEERLLFYPEVVCDGEDFLERFAAPAAVLVVVGLGLPLYALLINVSLGLRGSQYLVRATGDVRRMGENSRAYRIRYGFVFEPYHFTRYWWDCVVNALRAATVAAAVLLAALPLYRSQALAAVLVAALAAQSLGRPFATPLLNAASSVSLAAGALAAVAVAGYATYDEAPPAAAAVAAVAICGGLLFVAAAYAARNGPALAPYARPRSIVRRNVDRAGTLELVQAMDAGVITADTLVVRPFETDAALQLATAYRGDEVYLEGGDADAEYGAGEGSGSDGEA